MKFNLIILLLAITFVSGISVKNINFKRQLSREPNRCLVCYPGLTDRSECEYNDDTDQLHCASNGLNYENACIFKCIRNCNRQLYLRGCASTVGNGFCDSSPRTVIECNEPGPKNSSETQTTEMPTTTEIMKYNKYKIVNNKVVHVDNTFLGLDVHGVGNF